MSGPALDRVIAALDAHGCDPRRAHQGFTARCPAHADRDPSLGITNGDGKVLLVCRAGCPNDSVVSALGLKFADLFDESKAAGPAGKFTATYGYTDENGALLYEVVRLEPKAFRQRRPDGKGGWIWKLGDVRRVPYRLPELLAVAAAGGVVYVTEGEKDADAIRQSVRQLNGTEADAGVTATTNSGGAGKWDRTFAQHFRGASEVRIIADRDLPGRKHATDVYANLRAAGLRVRVLEAAEGKDASDHLAARLTLAQLVDMTDEYACATKPAPTAAPAEAPEPPTYLDDAPPLINGEPATRRAPVPTSRDLFGDDVVPTQAAFCVPGLVRAKGLHLWWAVPSGHKTYSLLSVALQLLAAQRGAMLFGHPDLEVLGPWLRVLWIATEEDAGGLRYRADKVRRGLGLDRPRGEFRYLWATDPNRPITLEDLPAILTAEGPFCAVILDSLTGLRPKVVQGRRVAWDVDNDAASELCLALRGAAEQHAVGIHLLHHTGRDTAKGYRGPTEYWASADVMTGLVPTDDGGVQVVCQKNRDGRRPDPFILRPEHAADTFRLTYDGAAPSEVPTEQAAEVARRVMAFLRPLGQSTQAEIITGTGCSRSNVQRALNGLLSTGAVITTGETRNRSPIFRATDPPEVTTL